MSDEVTTIKNEELKALTCFIRCASCHTLHVATSGWQISEEMTDAVWWARPKTLYKDRKVVCKHTGAVEQWNGTKWVPTVVRGAREADNG